MKFLKFKRGRAEERSVRLSRAVLVDTKGLEFWNLVANLSSRSEVNIAELVRRPTNIGDVNSSKSGQLVWCSKSGMYASYVALSRLIAKYAINTNFRNSFLQEPSRFKVLLYS